MATSAPHQQPIQEGLNLVIGIRASRLNESAVLLQIGKQSGKYGPAGSTAQLVCPNLTLCCYQRNATWAWFTIQECNQKNNKKVFSSFCLKQTNACPRPQMSASLRGSFILFPRYFYLFCGLIKGAGTFPLGMFPNFCCNISQIYYNRPCCYRRLLKTKITFWADQQNAIRDQWVKEDQPSKETRTRTRRWEKKPTAIWFPTFQGFEMCGVN